MIRYRLYDQCSRYTEVSRYAFQPQGQQALVMILNYLIVT